jgi:hypothetical protein
MHQLELWSELQYSGGGVCTMIGAQRQSDLISIGARLAGRSVGLGNSERNGYDRED